MYSEIREEARKLVEEALGEKVEATEIIESQKSDLSCPIAFKLASKQKKNPSVIASELASKIKPGHYIKKAEAAGGYVNFTFDSQKITAKLLSKVQTEKNSYGKGQAKNIKIILEHTSINPSGPLHIGRIRNCLIGDCMARVLRFSGYDVETHYFVNDVGKQIAIIAKGFDEKVSPDQEALKNYPQYKDKQDFITFFEYVAANRRYESDEEFAKRVQALIQKAEGGDAESLSKITDVAKNCLIGQSRIYERLGVKFDSFDFESKYIRNGAVNEVIEKLKKTEHFEETDRGFGINLKEYGIERREGASIIARKDGTSVYLSRDLAYHLEKSNLGDMMINVLGEDHKFEFIELKTILNNIFGLNKPLEAVHYSFVNFEGMELSTRKGQTAPVDKLLDEAVKKAETEVEKRGIASIDAAPLIAYGAVKYHILKTSPQKPITFKWDEALSFEGEAAPYIQYAHARCSSILEKANADTGKIEVEDIDTALGPDEENLIKTLLRFQTTVEKTAEERKPNIMASYVYELASSFSRFYKNCQVIVPEDKVRNRRLLLVNSTKQVLSSGLGLLGIDAPNKM